MIRIGIGIPTFNRQKSLEKLINSIKKYTTKVPYTLFCSVDGCNDGTVEMLMKNGIEFTYGKNIGPDKNKNRIFRRFSQYNYIFIIEDDMLIKKEGWVELYISACGLFNIPYFIFPKGTKDSYSEENMGNLTLNWLHHYQPGMLFYTRKVIERVGAIDSRLYSHGCLEQYFRMGYARVVPRKEGFPNIINAYDYIERNLDANYTMNYELKKKYNIQDKKMIDRLVNEFKATKNIYRKL